jgi:hypothetical protein
MDSKCQKYKKKERIQKNTKSIKSLITVWLLDLQQISEQKFYKSKENRIACQNNERKRMPTKNSIPHKIILQAGGEIKSFPDIQKLRESVTIRLALQDIPK